MAVERNKTFDPLSPLPAEEPEMEAMEDGEGETLSMALLGGQEVKPGDVVRIRVVSVDDEGGTWQGVYAQPSGGTPKMSVPAPTMEGMT